MKNCTYSLRYDEFCFTIIGKCTPWTNLDRAKGNCTARGEGCTRFVHRQQSEEWCRCTSGSVIRTGQGNMLYTKEYC